MLPSIEHFQKRLDSPRVCFLFYNYFFRAVVGENKWKSKLKAKDEIPMGSPVAEAYAHALIENNYFAWLFDYKVSSSPKKATIKTEYDSETVQNPDTDAWDDMLYIPKELDHIEIKKVTDGDGDGLVMISDNDITTSDKDDEADEMATKYLDARVERRQAQMAISRELKNDNRRKRLFDEMNKQVTGFKTETKGWTQADKIKEKRKRMKKLKACNKSNCIDGESSTSANHKIILHMTREIKKDWKKTEKGQFEKYYREMVKALDGNKSKATTNKITKEYGKEMSQCYDISDDSDGDSNPADDN